MELELVIERGRMERGRTFSAEALHEAARAVMLWMADQTGQQWDATGVPPTRAVLTVKLELQ